MNKQAEERCCHLRHYALAKATAGTAQRVSSGINHIL